MPIANDTLTATQRSLRLEVAADTRLVSMETAKAVLGVDSVSVEYLIDEGTLMAFNVAPGGGRLREIRIWIKSLAGVPAPPALSAEFDAVLADITGAKPWLRCGEAMARCNVDDNTVHRWIRQGLVRGERRGRTLWLETAALRDFLRRRLIGVGSP